MCEYPCYLCTRLTPGPQPEDRLGWSAREEALQAERDLDRSFTPRYSEGLSEFSVEGGHTASNLMGQADVPDHSQTRRGQTVRLAGAFLAGTAPEMLRYVIDALLAGLEGDGLYADSGSGGSECNVVQRTLVLTVVHSCSVCGAETPEIGRAHV